MSASASTPGILDPDPAGGRCALRRHPALRRGDGRPAPAGPRLLLGCRRGAPGRQPDALWGNPRPPRPCRAPAGPAFGGGPARAGTQPGADRRPAQPRGDRVSVEILDARQGAAGEIRWVTLNRPEARNALTFAMYDRIREIALEVNEDPSVRVLVLTGAGGKAFAAGTDISQFRAFDSEQDALAYEERMDAGRGALDCVRLPTLAAHAPRTLHTTKEALRRIRAQLTPPQGGSDLVVKAYMSEDFKEGIEAFFAKRPAHWKGR